MAEVSTVRYRCASCGAKLKLPDGIDRSRARCPTCGTSLSKSSPIDGRTRSSAQEGLPAALGRYRPTRFIAKGGMGMVYACHDPEDGRSYAIKVMHEALVRKEDVVQRFQREARLQMMIRHPHSVRCYACDRDGDRPYMVMELVQGPTLAEHLRQAGGRLPWRTAIDLIRPLASALAEMAAQELVHRDVKPANIIMSADGPKLTDFGLAKLLEAGGDMDGAYVDLTMTGTQMGTPSYMPPEQVEDAVRAEKPADVYALAATLYHVVCGVRPFEGTGALEVMQAVIEQQPPAPRSHVADLPPALDELLLWCLEKDPGLRPADCGELLLLLEQVAVQPEDADAIRQRRAERIAGCRRAMPVMLVALTMVALAGVVLWFLVR